MTLLGEMFIVEIERATLTLFNVVNPSSIVYFLVNYEYHAGAAVAEKELSVEEAKRLAQATAKEHEQFLSTCEGNEDLDVSSTNGYAHAPDWFSVSSSE